MYQNLFECAVICISIFLCGLSIKFLDELIDENRVEYIPYIMCFLCISSVIWNESISLFFSSYIVGMFHDENLKLISGLKSYQEQILVCVLSLLLVGIYGTISSLMIICMIQLLDDLTDLKDDMQSGKKNWVLKFGKVEVMISSLIFLSISVYLSIFKTIVCIISASIISYLFNKINKSKTKMRVIP
jgi:hypothetical protein